MNLLSNTKITTALDYTSGTATRTGAVLDMLGWDGVLIICKNATIAGSAAGDLHVANSAGSPPTDSTDDLLASHLPIVAGDSNKVVVIDVYRPLYRYLAAVVTKNGANAQAESVLYLQYNGDKLPITNMGADSSLLLISAAKGTK
jgi:hypothetical protein